MSFDAFRTLPVKDLAPRELYQLLISIVVPRPIGWISSMGNCGKVNLAPFSFFNAVAGNPPTLMVSISSVRGGPKDTLRNIMESREYVVHIVEEAFSDQMNLTSVEWPYEVNEFDVARLTQIASSDVRPPRIAEAAVAMETRLSQVVPVDGSSYTMILGRVVRFHVRADLLRANGLVSALNLQPLARLGGDEYATIGRVFEMPRPVV